MSDACPAPGPDDPLVRSLLGVVDCNVQQLVQTGYGSLFQGSGAFASLLTVLMTLYVALVGYQLLLGRSQLNITDFALTAVKLGAVVALATQWGAYQAIVYRFLFFGPQQVADVILHGFRANGSTFNGDVFDGLQRAFTDLTSFSPAAPPGAVATPPPGANPLNPVAPGGQIYGLLSKSGFDSLLLLGSAVVLLTCSLGVLLASKIVLGILLATGPLFIALLLFDSTRGVFEGWLRASLGFAFAPLAVTLMLGVALTMLEPSLDQLETMRDSNTYLPGVAFAVMVLVLVFAGVATAMVVAGGVIAGGFKLPRPRAARAAQVSTTVVNVNAADAAIQPRAARTAVAVAAQDRRDANIFAQSAVGGQGAALASPAGERLMTISNTTTERGVRDATVETRLGQGPRRNATPRAARSGARSPQ